MNAVLIIDKPAGITSHDVVARVRKITGEKSVGHLGTLDPLATGVLPLVLGKFTRLAQFFQEGEKEYTGVIRWGWSTDTYDAEGTPTSTLSLTFGLEGTLFRPDIHRPEEHPVMEISGSEFCLMAARQAAATLTGDIDQIPPPFSAKKVSGVPAYKKARRGEKVELKAKRVHVKQFAVLDLGEAMKDGEPLLLSEFAVTCSAGTYVRSLVHELGQKVGCGAHVLELRRTRSGEFSIDQAWKLEELENWKQNGYTDPARNIHPREILPHMAAVTAPPDTLGKIKNGGAVNLPYFENRIAGAPIGQQAPPPAPLMVKVFRNQNDLIAIAQRVAGTLFQPKIVLI